MGGCLCLAVLLLFSTTLAAGEWEATAWTPPAGDALVSPPPEPVTRTSGDWRYTVEAGGVALHAYTGGASQVTVPEQLQVQVNAQELAELYRLAQSDPQLRLALKVQVVNPTKALLKEGALTPLTLPVHRLGERVFAGNARLRAALIPETVKELGAEAFSGCTALTQVTLPRHITRIPNRAFAGCAALEQLDVPPQLSAIGYGAFQDCARLSRIQLPGTLRSIGTRAFSGCASLAKLSLSPQLDALGGHVFDGTPFLASQTQEFVVVGDGVLIRYNGSAPVVTVPKTVKQVVGAFEGNHTLRSVYLTRAVVNLGAYAFKDCANLTGVYVTQSLTRIQDFALDGCVRLGELALPEGLTAIGSYAFRGCANLSGLSLPKSVSSLGVAAFDGCARLREIEVPQGVDRLDSRAFAACPALLRAALPLSLEAIAPDAFAGSGQAKLLVVRGGQAEAFAIQQGMAYEYTLEAIGSFAVQRASGGVTLAAYRGNQARVEVPARLGGQPVTALGDRLFYGHEELEALTLPDTLQRIASQALGGCGRLTRLEVPSGVSYVAPDAFADCPRLTLYAQAGSLARQALERAGYAAQDLPAASGRFELERREDGTVAVTGYTGSQARLELPEQSAWGPVTRLGASALEGSRTLAKLTVPSGYTHLEQRALAKLANPVEVTLPDSVTYIDKTAFDQSKVTLRGSSGSEAERFAREMGIKFILEGGGT